jgi:fatty-acyl-CoA synthase
MRSWLEAHARFRPDHEALFDATSGRRWTYAELYDESLRWAGLLHRNKVGPGDRVAVLAHNRGETFALLFACAELGAILFPMNWRLSPEELHWQLGHSEPRVLLVDEAFADRVDHDALRIEAGPGDQRLRGPGHALEDAWQLMYTSGSMGRPKGALLTHGQALHNALNTIMACDLAPSDSTLTFTPMFHTGGMNCLSTPLLHRGGRVVLTRGVDVPQALRLIVDERITLLMGVPTIFQMMADHADFATSDLSSVRDALCGGAPLPLPLLERYLDRGIPLRQGFGMTEVGPNCFSMPPARVREKIGTVGLPIHHVETRLVRPDGTDCDVDEPGELLLRGPVVCAGYFRNPEATRDAIDERGWFHSGDLLSRDADGFFTVRGRIKEMYISGGENVYPAEVEAAIHAHPAVAHAAVIGVPDERWGEVGHAFVEARPGSALEASDLKCFLDDKLARFKLPKKIFVLPVLPRTASGKIDKVALRRPA